MQCDLILLADDDWEQAELTKRAFKKYCVVNPLYVVSDGTEVLSYLLGEGQYANREEYPLPTLLLLDLKMPRLNGFDVIRWVRAHEKFRTLPIVVLTASTDLADVNQAYVLGANSFLVKPVDFSEFVRMSAALQSYWMWLNKAPKLQGMSWYRLG